MTSLEEDSPKDITKDQRKDSVGQPRDADDEDPAKSDSVGLHPWCQGAEPEVPDDT